MVFPPNLPAICIIWCSSNEMLVPPGIPQKNPYFLFIFALVLGSNEPSREVFNQSSVGLLKSFLTHFC